uniref:Uncharacterized protein n=1 Tax=Arundo donax TaxID=35708 RepID=A0A0A9AM87_ARUDO
MMSRINSGEHFSSLATIGDSSGM